jgi:ABC-type amino acid transport substrate-binding protein
MFTTIIIISSITAAITSALTVNELNVAVQGIDDLPDVRVATVDGSTSEAYLQEKKITYKTFANPLEAMTRLSQRKFDAFIYDAPLLQYLTKNKFSGEIEVLPQSFAYQYYAMALPENSPYRESINRVLLQILSQPVWQDILNHYLVN